MSMALNPCQAPVSRLLLRPRVYYTAGPDHRECTVLVALFHLALDKMTALSAQRNRGLEFCKFDRVPLGPPHCFRMNDA